MLNKTFIGIKLALKGNYYKRQQKLHQAIAAPSIVK